MGWSRGPLIKRDPNASQKCCLLPANQPLGNKLFQVVRIEEKNLMREEKAKSIKPLEHSPGHSLLKIFFPWCESKP